ALARAAGRGGRTGAARDRRGCREAGRTGATERCAAKAGAAHREGRRRAVGRLTPLECAETQKAGPAPRLRFDSPFARWGYLSTTSTTRRFCARLSRLLLSVTGADSPYEMTLMRCSGMCCCMLR